MRLAIILLLALFCYAQLAESGGRKRKMKNLAKQIKNLQEDIECLKDDMKRCKSELKVLDDKFAKMLTCLYKSKFERNQMIIFHMYAQTKLHLAFFLSFKRIVLRLHISFLYSTSSAFAFIINEHSKVKR